MKMQNPVWLIALVVAALLSGILLDRLVQSASNPTAPTEKRDASLTSGKTSDGPMAATSSGADAAAVSHESTARKSVASSAAQKASLDSILTEHDPRERLRDLTNFISALTPVDYPDAFKRIQQITSSNERELASRLLLAQWAQTDPDGALQFAAGNRGYEYVAEDVFAELAGADFESALNRAKAIPGADLRYRALRGILSFKADSDPIGALQLAGTLGEFHGNEPLNSVVYRQWAARDPQAAASNAAEAPAAAERWRSPVASVVQTWAQQDPAAAAKWSLSLGDAEAQSRSVSQVMREWARQDPTAAANWIYGLESGGPRDLAVAGFAQALVPRDPQTALNWIGTITDGNTRTATLERVSGTVMWRDPQNGAAMLQAAGLAPDQIQNNRGRRGR